MWSRVFDLSTAIPMINAHHQDAIYASDFLLDQFRFDETRLGLLVPANYESTNLVRSWSTVVSNVEWRISAFCSRKPEVSRSSPGLKMGAGRS